MNPSLTQIPEDPTCQSQYSTESLSQTSEVDLDTKEENVDDEPEARMGRLSETGKQIFGVVQQRAVIAAEPYQESSNFHSRNFEMAN